MCRFWGLPCRLCSKKRKKKRRKDSGFLWNAANLCFWMLLSNTWLISLTFYRWHGLREKHHPTGTNPFWVPNDFSTYMYSYSNIFRWPRAFSRICIRICYEINSWESCEVRVSDANQWCSELFTYVHVYWILIQALKQKDAFLGYRWGCFNLRFFCFT